jgi:hypothetical protein
MLPCPAEQEILFLPLIQIYLEVRRVDRGYGVARLVNLDQPLFPEWVLFLVIVAQAEAAPFGFSRVDGRRVLIVPPFGLGGLQELKLWQLKKTLVHTKMRVRWILRDL